MTVLSKALSTSRAFGHSVTDNALRLKQSGMLTDAMTPSAGGLGEFQSQTRNRQQYALFRGWLYSAINALALEAASQPVMMGRMKGAKPKEERQSPSRVKQFQTRKMTKTARSKSARTELEIVEDDPILDVLEQPNFMQSRNQFVYTFIANLCLTGWGYIVAGKHKDRMEFYSLPTTWIRPDHKKGLFSQFYIVDPSKPAASQMDQKPLDRSQVAFVHLPNPSDPRSALAPATSQIQAIRIDDHIQTSQERFFENGIFPSSVVTIGKRPYMDTQGRPVLTGAQRRQITGALRKLLGGVANYGNFAIVDGLIEKIERMSMTQTEMGWEKSEDKVRTRILSAYSVHPYILGEPVGVGGYAQVANIEKRFYKRVNAYLDMLGVATTNLIGNAERDDKILVWWEECEPHDPTLRNAMIRFARQNDDISQNELRAELGFAPDEDRNESVIGKGLSQHLLKLIEILAGGGMTPEQAVAVMEGWGLPTPLAKKLSKSPGKEEEVQEEETVEQATEVLEEAVAMLRMTPREMAGRVLSEVR